MNKTFFTSDTHFGHTNIIKYTNRPFSSVEEMNDVLIQNWNAKVKAGDTVYHLGDFAFGEKYIHAIFPKLNGRIILIKGNHDKRDVKVLRQYAEVHEALEIKNDRLGSIILFHYPILEWDKIHRGAGHLYGHKHSPPGTIGHGRSFDIGVDANGYAPRELDDVIAQLESLPILSHH